MDDEPDMEALVLQKFRKQLKEERFRFAFAQNGKLALESLKENEDMCMVVTDINMPEMDGLKLLTELSKLDRPLRTMVVSAYGDMKNIRSAMNRGAFDFVTKPIDFDDFETTLEKTLEDIRKIRNSLETQKELEEERHRRMEAQEEGLRILERSALMLSEANVNLETQVQERTRELSRKNEELQFEIERSEHLLLNILPFQTAQELKQYGKAEARFYPEVTVMFTDFRGFTKIAEQLGPAELVAEIDICFKEFDRIMEIHGVEKIKTIGDSYMAASGLPLPSEDHAEKILKAAFDIRAYMLLHKAEREKAGKPVFEVRIGIHSGPVVAGIVGSKKFAYDIWGDAVNLASRMETSCETNHINISGSTYEKVKHVFECLYRGQIEAKSKGLVDMYYAIGPISETLVPQTMKQTRTEPDYEAAIDSIRTKLETELPAHFPYHSLRHILDVYVMAEKLAVLEGVPEEDLWLLRTAVMFHDAGFLVGPADHEVRSCALAREMLPGFGFQQEHIQKIEGMILATRIPQSPQNHLEQIICDADLDYLGREDFWMIGARLFEELKQQGFVKSEQDWNQRQAVFLKQHQYFTASAQSMRDDGKAAHLKAIEQKLAYGAEQDRLASQ